MVDGLQLLDDYANERRAAFFIDPPYTAGHGKRAGRRLYAHFELDHERLFQAMARCRGSFLMTYDDDAYVTGLATRHGFEIRRIPMKNTHHEKKFEVIITRGNCR